MKKEKIFDYVQALACIMQENKECLIQMDSVVGDGDLGLTMSDGFQAANEAMQKAEVADLGQLLYQGGKAMANAVPSTMGTLMASGLMQAGKSLRGKTEMGLEEWIIFFEAYEMGVMKRGKAKIGEKTFLDGIHPAIESLKDHPATLAIAAKSAAEAAQQGFKNTRTMVAVHGRAAIRGEASRELEDPGAYVAQLMMEAFYDIMK